MQRRIAELFDRAWPGAMSVQRVVGVVLAAVGALLGAKIAWQGIQHAYVGPADSAHTIAVARALVEGRGFTVDYIAHHFRSWSVPSHPEDSFPLGHPLAVAGVTLLTRDPIVAAHVFGGLLIVTGFAGLPLLVLRWWGAAAACATTAALIALEQLGSYFQRPLNDPPATVLIGLAGLLVVRAIEVRGPQASNRVLLLGATLGAVATQIKPSSNAFVLGLAMALLADGSRTWAARLGRASFFVGVVALAHLPTIAWYWSAHGEVGIPNNAVGRNLARELGAREDFWAHWDRARTYWPEHPGDVLTTTVWIAREGAWSALVLAPVARARRALDHALLRSEVIPYAMLFPMAWAAARPAPRSAAARAVLLSVLAAPLLAVYSHYEPRYFHPLRPLCALAVGAIVRDARAMADEEARDRVDRAALLVLVAAVLLGAAGVAQLRLDAAAFGGLLVGFGLAIFAVTRRRGAADSRDLVARLALPSAAAVAIACACGVPRGLQRLVRSPPHHDDAALGAWIASVTLPGDVVISRRVPELALFSRRGLVILPYHTDDVCIVAHHYGARWLLVEPGDTERQAHPTRLLSTAFVAAVRRDATLFRLECNR